MKNLSLIRKANGLTQVDLAEMAGTTQPTINRMEAGGDSVTLRMIRKVAHSLGVPVYALFLDDMSAAELALIRASRGLSPEDESAWVSVADDVLNPSPKDD